jgi:hypothetical protein
VHGDDLLYRFLNQMLSEDDEHLRAVPRLMIQAMAIWFPLEVYRQLPVLLPWVVRDPSCRGRRREGIADQWASPDTGGFLRDDNSLVKSLPRSLLINSPGRERGLRGARMGTEFVAAHIWRVVGSAVLASRHPMLNTFVPNLVWLPAQVAKLSDREGGPVQRALQSMAWSLYRDAPVEVHLRDVVEEAWRLLPSPAVIHPVNVNDLNLFVPTARFLTTRHARISLVIDYLERLDQGSPLPRKVIATRYTDGLPGVGQAERQALLRHLRRFQR